MADIYSSGDALLRDYEKLSQEYKNKAGKCIKNLLKIYRAEKGVSDEANKLERPSTIYRSTRCSFCGKREEEVARMIQGPVARICDSCVALCHEVLLSTPLYNENGNDNENQE